MHLEDKKYLKSIWWIKRDMRLIDNEALFQAINQSKYVVPVFIFEDILINADETSIFHINAWIQGLTNLRNKLRNIGGDIYIRTGDIEKIFDELGSIYEFEAIFSHVETGSHITFDRDKKIKKYLQNNNIEWLEYSQNSVQRGIKTIDGRENAWDNFMNVNKNYSIASIFLPQKIKKMTIKQNIPSIGSFGLESKGRRMQHVDEDEAQKLLHSFLYKRSKNYIKEISSPLTAFNHGSRLSPHIAWGTISLRHIHQRTQERINELRLSTFTNSWIFSL